MEILEMPEKKREDETDAESHEPCEEEHRADSDITCSNNISNDLKIYFTFLNG